MEKVYRCIVCDHIHQEDVEGAWETLPEDFTCPECGAGKLDYESVDL